MRVLYFSEEANDMTKNKDIYTDKTTYLEPPTLTEPELHVVNENPSFKGKAVWVPVICDETDTNENLLPVTDL